MRREDEYVLPVGPALTATAGPVPDGVTIVPADEKESDRLARLDERLRQDVPGSDGWVNDPVESRSYTFDQHFDPRLYLVAVVDGDYAGPGPGLARQPGTGSWGWSPSCAGTAGAG